MTVTESKIKWAERQLGEFFRVKHGYAFKGEYFSSSGDYIVLTPGNFYDEGGFKKKANEKYYTGQVPSGFILTHEDLIVAMTEQAEGLLGSAAIVPEDNLYLHNQRLGLITNLDKTQLDKKFLYYLFNSQNVRGQIRASANGVKVRHTSPDRIYQVKFRLPPLPTQRKIAGILSAYDRLIENNTRRIEILEEMARSIYCEWFVKFRFPGHEQVQMVDSELGLIPEDWEVKKLGEVIRFKNGKSIKVEEEGDYLVYGSNGIIGRTNEARYQNAIIIGRVGAYCGSLIYSKSAFNASDNTIIAESASEKFSLELAFYVLEQMNLRHYAGGAAQPLLTQTVIKEIPAIVPDIKTNKNFQIIIANLINFKSNLTNKIQNLCQTRDLLLPRLISGEIDVENLDINTGEIAA